MRYQDLLQQTIGVTLVTLFSVGCGAPLATPTPVPPTDTPVPAAATPIPLPDIPLDVTVTKDLVYAKGIQPERQREWKLDEYAPTERGPWPLVLFLSGRGQIKEAYATLSQAISEQGAIVLVIDYPNERHPTTAILDNGKGYREMAETVACAIRFARARASDFGMDAAPVVIAGFCLGGGVGSHVALVGESLDRRWEEYAASRGGPPRQVDCEVGQGSTHVDALVGIAGPYDAFVGYDGKYGREYIQEKDFDLWKMLYSSIGENRALLIRLLHGKIDPTVAYENSVEFEEVLAEAGYDVKLIQFHGGHTVPLELTVETVMDAVKD